LGTRIVSMLLDELLEKTTQSIPDKTALICQDSKYTYSEIYNSARALAEALVTTGFQKQDRAVVFLDNSVESVISLFGILMAGGIFIIINPQVKAPKLAYIIADCRARILVSDSNHLKAIGQTLPQMPGLEQILVTDKGKYQELDELSTKSKVFDFKAIVRRNTSYGRKSGCIDLDLASLIYTSGSSGSPKGVMLTHHNMIAAAESITQYLENTPDDVILDALPLSFDYGLYQILMAFMVGATVVLEKGFVFPEQILRTIVKEKVTGWPIVPTMAAMLCRQTNLSQHDFSRLRYITSTGQALPGHHIARLREAFPETKIFSMYGLTECKRVSYLPPDQLDQRPGSVGKAIPNTEVYLVDEAGKEISGAGITGELVVRGSNVMRGYWNLPEATAKALRPGRYPGEQVLFTGDLFKKDNEGYLYFLGRKDDIIKTSGHMVSPKEVENVLCEMNDIIEAAVIGIEDDILGQSVKAFVHVTESSGISEKDIVCHCYKYLEDYAVPKHVVFYGPLPRTESGKIQKRKLLEPAKTGEP
jgi:long-chain acyl-CoA synthetase